MDNLPDFLNIYIFFKSRIRETLNLSTNADSSTDIFVSAGVKKGADINFLFASPPPKLLFSNPPFKERGFIGICRVRGEELNCEQKENHASAERF